MKKSENYVGKTFKHPDLKLVFVDSFETRTKVNVTVIDKGKGWSEKTQSYKGVKNSVGWMRGENREYLKKDVVHIKDLEPCQ